MNSTVLRDETMNALHESTVPDDQGQLKPLHRISALLDDAIDCLREDDVVELLQVASQISALAAAHSQHRFSTESNCLNQRYEDVRNRQLLLSSLLRRRRRMLQLKQNMLLTPHLCSRAKLPGISWF
jgi:hypothetical protein